MDYKKLHEETLAALQKMVLDGKITEETAGSICSDFIKESEYERIRKRLIKIAKTWKDGGYACGNDNEIDDILAWLEKQGERKPEIKYIYPKFRVGDVIEPAKPNGSFIPVRVRYIGNGSYYCEADDRKAFSSIPICNENEYVLTEQKPAWSEEDKNLFDLLSACVCYYINDPNLEYSKREKVSKEIVPFIEMLKSLKPQTHWKPSDEQMKALNEIINTLAVSKHLHDHDYLFNILYGLRKNLKKL